MWPFNPKKKKAQNSSQPISFSEKEREFENLVNGGDDRITLWTAISKLPPDNQRELFNSGISYIVKRAEPFVRGVINTLNSQFSEPYENRAARTIPFMGVPGKSLEEIYYGEDDIPRDYLVALIVAARKQSQK